MTATTAPTTTLTRPEPDPAPERGLLPRRSVSPWLLLLPVGILLALLPPVITGAAILAARERRCSWRGPAGRSTCWP